MNLNWWRIRSDCMKYLSGVTYAGLLTSGVQGNRIIHHQMNDDICIPGCRVSLMALEVQALHSVRRAGAGAGAWYACMGDPEFDRIRRLAPRTCGCWQELGNLKVMFSQTAVNLQLRTSKSMQLRQWSNPRWSAGSDALLQRSMHILLRSLSHTVICMVSPGEQRATESRCSCTLCYRSP